MENSVPSVHTRPLREPFFGDLLSIDSPYNPWNSASTSPPLRMENTLALRKSYTLFSHLGPLFRLDMYFWKMPFLSLPIWILQLPHINLEPFSFAPHFLSATIPSHPISQLFRKMSLCQWRIFHGYVLIFPVLVPLVWSGLVSIFSQDLLIQVTCKLCLFIYYLWLKSKGHGFAG